jgi:flagellin-like hook-associated protein FlgL
MALSGISPAVAPLIQSTLDLNNQLDKLQEQLGTGQKSSTYAGLGSQGGIAVSLNAQLAALGSFDSSMTVVGTTINLQQQVLQQVGSVGSSVQTSVAQPSFVLDNTGQTSAQQAAASQLDQVLGLLNTEGGNGYLFSGTSPDQQSVESTDHILNGDGTQAGLKQVIAERLKADQGSDGLGRLLIPVPAPASTVVSVAEDAAGSPFGLKLGSVDSSLTGATVTPTPGPPQSYSIDLGGTNPNDGDTISFTFNLPDGTTQTLALQATTSGSPGPNQFTIGATSDLTADNLQAALAAGVTQIGQTTLPAASAVAASNNFFDQPPLRVSGTPATATALVAGTSANTVFWYTGGTTPATLKATGGSAITAATAGTFDITSAYVNGGSPVAVTVANGDSLAAVVTKINTALGAGSDVQASLSGGQIVLTSATGNQFTIADASGNLNGTTVALGFNSGTSLAPIRSAATARIDPATTISFGTQANEQGIRSIVQSIATLAATTYSASDPNGSASYTALNQRIYSALAVPPGVQGINDIAASLSNAQVVMQATQSQHQQTTNVLTDLLQSIEGVDQNTIGAQILSLQTSLQATLSATARMSQLNLVTYLAPVSG